MAAIAVCLGLSVVASTLATTALQVAASPGGTSGRPTSGRTALVAAERSGAVSAAVVPAPEAVVAAAAAAPVSLRVPSLGIDAPLERLGVNGDGTLEVPTDAAQAGWFDRGPAPGDVGPAVVAGHVDSHSGPGVFARLASAAVGAQVDVDREDGSTVRFVVTGVEQVAKDAFPSEDVYGPVAGPELRLITCGGVFDDATGHYVDNVVVFAREG